MKIRSLTKFCLLIFVLFSIAAIAVITPTRALSQSQVQSAAMSKIAPWVLEQTANGKQAEFLIVLADQADLSGAEALKTKEEKGLYVRNALWNKAQTTQGPLLQWLREHNIEHRSYYIVNLIWAKAGLDIVQALTARPDVLRVEGNPQIRNIPDPLPAAETPAGPESTTAIEPGVNYTRAPLVWALGYTGQGSVVAGADTGYQWDHPALKNKYRGWNGSVASHDYNWHDSIHSNAMPNTCGSNSPQPCDDNSHGTHTMGTVLGDDGANNQIGMAPGAKWIGCRNMDGGNGTPATYIECMEFFLAPYPVSGTPAQGNPDLAPDVTNNSWGCPESEGCSPDSLKAAVEAQRAAGIMMVVSAGNGGPACSTVQDPPAIYDAVYSIGALNTGADTIASFSSHGPVLADMSLRRKPDLCAPGTGTRSSVPGNGYGNKQGTSMSSPHVAGAVALLHSAHPALRGDVSMSETILNETAVHLTTSTCDAPSSPNNTFGYGRLDIKAAVDRALTLLRLTGAVSRKTHPGAGTFAISLPLTGTPGVECRSSSGNHTLVFTFNNNVVSGNASVTSGSGNVSGSPTFAGKTMTVNLTGVADVQKITVTLSNVTDSFSQVLPNTAVSVNMLIGDTTGNKIVNASDISQTKSQSGLVVSGGNFRADVNVSGTLTASDVALVKSRSGVGVP